MDQNGDGLLLDCSRLHMSMSVAPEHFKMDKFIHMCVLSGCDYLPSLQGIGIQTAYKFIQKSSDPDIHKVRFYVKGVFFLELNDLTIFNEFTGTFSGSS